MAAGATALPATAAAVAAPEVAVALLALSLLGPLLTFPARAGSPAPYRAVLAGAPTVRTARSLASSTSGPC